MPPPPALQPSVVAAGGGTTGQGGPSAGGANASPFIFNPYAGKREALEQKQRGKRALGVDSSARGVGGGNPAASAGPDWVSVGMCATL